MASRMDRYHKSELITSGRSSKNKSLYDQIKDLDNYTNIEGVATIEKTNEIDIAKVQEMIKNRENYKKQKQLRTILKEEKEELEKIEEIEEQTKNYDIRDLLSKVKDETIEQKDSRSLKQEQYELLKSLKQRGKSKAIEVEKEEEELKELLNTITNTKAFCDLTSADVGLLDDLKSDTMVGDVSSIKKIIEEEKENKIENTDPEIDKSFYTSSFGFTQSDFEELKNMNNNIKKGNKFIIILLVMLIVVVIVLVIFFLLNK